MELYVSKFRDIMYLLKPAVPGKPSLEVLKCILLKDGKAVATDMDTMVVMPLPEVDIEALVPFKKVMDVLQYVAGTEKLKFKSSKGSLSLKWSSGSANFPTKDPDTFPAVPEFAAAAETDLNGDNLIPGLASLRKYAAKESDRAVLNGITLMLGEKIKAVAGDGFRMADTELDGSFPEERTLVMPLESIPVLEHLWKKSPRAALSTDALIPALTAKKMVNISVDGEKGIQFRFARGLTAIVKLIQGNPPDFLKLIPKDEPVLKASFYAPELEVAINRVKSMASEGAGMVRMDFKDSQATIWAGDGDLRAESSISTLNAEGVPNKLAINAKYILDYLNGKEGLMTLSWTGQSAPIAFHSHNHPRVLIMPMKYE